MYVSEVVAEVEGSRSAGRQPRVHGNGFVQLDLNEAGTRRLHVWHERVPRQAVATPVHDHVFDLRSVVLCGQLVHEILSCHASPDGEGTHVAYRAIRQGGTENTVLVPEGGFPHRVTLEVEQKLILGAGSVYTFPAGELHQTGHIGLTATVMDKVNAPEDYGSPRVLVPVGSEPDNEFHRDAHDADELWALIQLALSTADSWALMPV